MEEITNLLNSGIAEVLLNFSLVFVGIFAHFIKKCKVEKISLLHYWKDQPYNSMLSLIGAFVGFVVLLKMGDSNIISYFRAGYLADSMLNRVKLPKIEENK